MISFPKYTDEEVKELPMTQEEQEGYNLLVESHLINNVKFWLIMGGLLSAVYLILRIPGWVTEAVYSYFGVTQ